MRFDATFTGANRSAGFITGRRYALQVLTDDADRPRIVYADPPGNGQEIPYGSWKAFWKNWRRKED